MRARCASDHRSALLPCLKHRAAPLDREWGVTWPVTWRAAWRGRRLVSAMALDSEATAPLGVRIRAHRQRLGLSQSAFAAALDRLAWERAGAPDRWRTLGVDQPMVSDWERGRHRPDAYYQDLLCALLGVTAYELGFRKRLPWEPDSQEHDEEPAVPPAWTLARTAADIAGFAERDLNGTVGNDFTSIVFGARLTEAVQPPATCGFGQAGFATSKVLGPDDVQRLERLAQGMRHWDERVRRGIQREFVVSQLSAVAGLLRDRHANAITRRLLRVVAELAEIAASMSYDAGQQAAAQHYFVYALHAARAADEPLIAACVLGDMARQMLDLFRPDDALELVRVGLDGLGSNAPGRLRAMLRTREAWAYAVTGRTQAFHRAASLAWDAFSDAGPAEPYRLARFDAAELNGVLGARYRDLARHDAGQARRAHEHISEALTLRDRGECRGRIFDLIGLARTDVMLGEAEAAADAARRALAVMDDARSGRARRRLRDFYRESGALDTSAIRDVRDAIADRLSSSYLRLHGEAEAT
jgi:transcriptional regulator with XRE-family HTH domain